MKNNVVFWAFIAVVVVLGGCLFLAAVQRDNARKELETMTKKYEEEYQLTNLVRQELKKKEAEMAELQNDFDRQEQEYECVGGLFGLTYEAMCELLGVYDVCDLSEEEINDLSPEAIAIITELHQDIIELASEYMFED